MDKFPLDKLPADCLTVIASHVPAPNGDEAITKVKALSLVNTRMLTALNSQNATTYITNSFAKRFGTDPLIIADELKTPGARKWLMDKIRDSEDYKLFKMIQKIKNVADEAQERLDPNATHKLREWPRCDAMGLRTKQGLYACIGAGLNSVMSPWGLVDLTRSGSYWGLLAQTQHIFKQVKTKFIRFDESNEDDVVFYEICQPIDLAYLCGELSWDLTKKYQNSIKKEISLASLEGYKGRECLLRSSNGSEGLYEITQVDQEPVIPAMEQGYVSNDERCALQRLWRIMEDRYKNEISNQESVTPLTLSIKPRITSDQQIIHNPCPSCGQSNCFIKCALCTNRKYCSLACQTEDWPKHVRSSHQNVENIEMHVANYIDILRRLAAQPLFDGKGAIEKKCKVLPIENEDENVEICQILCHRANEVLKKDMKWYISKYAGYLYDTSGNLLKPGIILDLSQGSQLCSLQTLAYAFKNVLSECKQGWILSDAKKYPNILHKPSDIEDYYLFIKKESTFFQEHDLIAWLATKYSIKNKLKIGNGWLDKKGWRSSHEDKYIFIKKDVIHIFNQYFGFPKITDA